MGHVDTLLHRWAARVVLAHCLAASSVYGQTPLDREALASLATFEIAVSVHAAEAAEGTEVPGLLAADLAEHVQRRFEASFPGVPYRAVPMAAAPEQSDPGLGQLSCRVWFDGRPTPAVFQVRCQISSVARTNIVSDGSFGYGPAERAPDIIRRQIDHILGGFALIYLQAKEAK